MTIYDDLFVAPGRTFTINPRPYRVHATFRIFHVDLDPDALTKLFSVQPTTTHRSGDPRTGKRGRLYAPFSKGCWSLDSENYVNSKDVNDHINWLLSKMSSCTYSIHKLHSLGYSIDVMCGWFTESDNTCPTLHPETMRRLALLRVKCWFDIYMFPPDD